jgi:hypothetical protein
VFYFSRFIEDCNAYLAVWSPANVANKPSGQKTISCKRHNSQACFRTPRMLQKLTGTDAAISSELLRGRSRAGRPRWGNRLRHLDAKNR